MDCQLVALESYNVFRTEQPGRRQKFATLSPRYVSGDTKYEICKQIKILYFR